MGISQDIQAAITKNLSAEVGQALQARLKQADVDAAQAQQVPKLQSQLQAEMNGRAIAEREVVRLNAVLAAQEEKAKALDRKATELEYQEKLLAQSEKSAAVRVDDLKEIVRTVFCSPVSKSRVLERSSEPLVHPQTGYQQGQKDITRSVESESTGPGLQAPT